MTSFAGLVLFQPLFAQLGLKARLADCFQHLRGSPIYGRGLIALALTVHLLIGFRRLRDMAHYRDDPMVLRLLGVTRLPDPSTLSRALADMDGRGVANLRQANRELVLERLTSIGAPRVTLDFDGSVIATGRCAEGAAVGFNRKKKGQRSYYPLFCMVAQTGHALDIWHRPGNVHDSNGAEAFIEGCIQAVRAALPGCVVEVRIDSAFFSDAILGLLEREGVEFTVSVPFARFAALKSTVEGRKRWRRLDGQSGFFEAKWKPKSWGRRRRIICVKQRNPRQRKGAVQLELYTPCECGYDFKAVVTNKRLSAKKALVFHNGRGAQEGLFAELKSQAQMDYVPTRRLAGNQAYTILAMLAHNLNREMQMRGADKDRGTTERRAPLWRFEQLGSIRRKLIQRAGRLTRPQGKLTLTMSANAATKSDLLSCMGRLMCAA